MWISFLRINLNSAKLQGGAGKGQLTQVGEKEMFELGQHIRERYVNNMKFLSAEYSSNEI